MKALIKKIIVFAMVLLSTTAVFSISNSTPVYADDLGSCRDFLGMTSWDCGIKANPGSEDELKENIRTIIANIFADIGILATYLAIGYIIYGGYLYMFSSGDPAKAMIGRKTLTRAFIGLGIVMLANIILHTIRIATIGSNGSFEACSLSNGTGCVDPSTLVKNLVNWFIGVSGLVAVIFIVVGGVGYMTSRGDPGKLQKAKSTIMYSIIGLIIVALSMAIFNFVYDIFNKNSDFENYGPGQSSLIQESDTISLLDS